MSDEDTRVEEEIAAQMGDDETTTAEPEPEPEQEPEPEPEPETAPPPTPPPPPPTDAVMEKRFQAAERAVTAYAKKIGDIFGDEAIDLTPCPLCPDLHKGFVNVHDAGRVPKEIVDVVQVYLGFAREQDYEPDPDVSPCTRCKGKGKTKTGSTVQGNESIRCKHCNGYGYYPPPSEAANGRAASADFHYPAGEAPEPLADEDVDLSGEPRFLPDGRPNPNFGMWPQYKVQVPPWGTTAHLTAQDAIGA